MELSEIIKGIEDIKGDAIFNIKTLAVVYGIKKAFYVSLIILVIVLIMSPLPYILKICNIYYLIMVLTLVDIPIIFSIYTIIRCLTSINQEDKLINIARRLRSVLKISMFFGPLSFIAGII